ncbi:MAG: CRTAC1 family protein, partial [Deltaproteobacteria bacterium]|nr:CRTAC1 family protein [Deltaproteobacteria bacterium]
ATGRYFPMPLRDVEMAALADVDGDGWLDLWLVFSQYAGARPGGVWRFEPSDGRFVPLPSPKLGVGKRSCGGIALADVNRDGVLDAYISFGLDWDGTSPNLHETPSPHEFWISHAGGWRDAWRERMPEEITRTSFAGMTAYFGDLNEDGALDLLVGNDFLDPSLFLTQAPTGAFQLAPRRWVEANTIHSMSYLPVDLDGDGDEELLEVGAAPPWAALTRGESSVDTSVRPRLPRHQELKQLVSASARGKYGCAGYQDGTVRWLCAAHLAMERAILKTDAALCRDVPPGLVRAFCERQVRQMRLENYALPQSVRYDVERFPKQVMDNVVLKRLGPRSGYGLVGQPKEVTFTGWSWAAYPEDLDGDGRQDLAITNGYMKTYFHPNRVLRNASLPGRPRLEEVTVAAGLGFGDQSRGLVAADFDEDGDADLLVGNQAGEPQYLVNQSGGDRVEVELRMKGPNRYAVGATVTLLTSAGPQKRRMAVGGVWNTSQPQRLRYSLPEGVAVSGMDITWPNGQRTHHPAPAVNARTIIFL